MRNKQNVMRSAREDKKNRMPPTWLTLKSAGWLQTNALDIVRLAIAEGIEMSKEGKKAVAFFAAQVRLVDSAAQCELCTFSQPKACSSLQPQRDCARRLFRQFGLSLLCLYVASPQHDYRV